MYRRTGRAQDRARGHRPPRGSGAACASGPALFPGREILERAASSSGSRVAYAGTNLPYYLLGIGLRNEIHYININDGGDGLAHDYDRRRHRAPAPPLARDPWPQWYRTDADFSAWVENLRRHGIEFLLIARENRHGRLGEPPGTLARFPIEKDWAEAHPEQFVDLGPFPHAPATTPWVRVYRLLPAR